MIKINLLTERRAAPSKVRVPRIEMGASAENLLYAAILVVALGFCAFQWWSLGRELRTVSYQLEEANREVETVREGLRIIAELEAKKALIERQVRRPRSRRSVAEHRPRPGRTRLLRPPIARQAAHRRGSRQSRLYQR